MLHKYRALLQHSEQRLLAGQRRLAQERQRLAAVQDECLHLEGEIAMQQQLAGAGDLNGAALDRRQLFGWLRTNAADRRRSQALRLELRRQQELGEQAAQQVGMQHALCLHLEGRRDLYRTLLADAQKKVHMRQLETEESEIEERLSWSK